MSQLTKPEAIHKSKLKRMLKLRSGYLYHIRILKKHFFPLGKVPADKLFPFIFHSLSVTLGYFNAGVHCLNFTYNSYIEKILCFFVF